MKVFLLGCFVETCFLYPTVSAACAENTDIQEAGDGSQPGVRQPTAALKVEAGEAGQPDPMAASPASVTTRQLVAW